MSSHHCNPFHLDRDEVIRRMFYWKDLLDKLLSTKLDGEYNVVLHSNNDQPMLNILSTRICHVTASAHESGSISFCCYWFFPSCTCCSRLRQPVLPEGNFWGIWALESTGNLEHCLERLLNTPGGLLVGCVIYATICHTLCGADPIGWPLGQSSIKKNHQGRISSLFGQIRIGQTFSIA